MIFDNCSDRRVFTMQADCLQQTLSANDLRSGASLTLGRVPTSNNHCKHPDSQAPHLPRRTSSSAGGKDVFRQNYCIPAAEAEQDRLHRERGGEEVSWARIRFLEVDNLGPGPVREVRCELDQNGQRRY